ncbi:hypothetical protein ACUXAV_000656 [Cupriavidus metallidurans]|jgi:hypothetical protein|uniref:hypothetical protein n=1 Tax=Cupriavidus TaxID=106589 RepID=UPI00046B6BD7|nr:MULTISPECIES: hypothetical protein [Cupriavidus]AVA33360.1 hypothetical protein C3Z06_06790 [Cupriavidus metallidurans]KWR79039.1 hypothetical protein RN01_22610 [Cupriavidus sp. SHE]MDE4918557.1 hypothetical protein [Cupriavidus metallidurans]
MDQNTELNQQGGEGAGVPTKQPDAAPKKPDAAPKAKLPKKMILQALYGFYDDAGRLWQWVEGQIVDDVEHIKMLVERKAPAVEHKED